MFFLLRVAFWIMLICLLLPNSRDDNRRLVQSAERTFSDLRGFCQRNPEVCEDAHVSITSIWLKLKNGAGMIQTWFLRDDRREDERAGNTTVPDRPTDLPPRYERGNTAPVPLAPNWQDSLSPQDKQMPWRGPSAL
jgi:hypothetical protein